MHEPSPRTSRLAIAGGMAAIVAVGGGGFLLGRVTVPPPPPVVRQSPVPAVSSTPAAKPSDDQLLRRSDLIALGAAAADASASGAKMSPDALAQSGKRFELNLRFGCEGPAAEDADLPMRWHYDEAAGALRIHVAPILWQGEDWLQDSSAVEAMEGFWIPRPWSSSEACPIAPAVSAAPGAASIALPGQTLGLVQLITPDTPRQMRRGEKPYEAVIRTADDTITATDGLILRVAGRIGRFPDGEPVRCRQPGGGAQPPICLIAAMIEEVSFRNPANGEAFASWQPTVDAPSGERIRE